MSPAGPGIDASIAEAFREQRRALWGFFLRGAGNSAEAEDLLQETCLRVWDAREEIGEVAEDNQKESARRYLWRVARNLMIDEIRARQRHRAHEAPAASVASEPSRPERDIAAQVEHEDSLRVVRETVGHLKNERTRRCLKAWLSGADVTSIASRLELRADQVRGALQRGRAEVVRRAAARLSAGASTGSEAGS